MLLSFSSTVNDGTEISSATISNLEVTWNQWFNLGASWRPGSAPRMFVNTQPIGHGTLADVPDAVDMETARIVHLGSSETSTVKSAWPIKISDFVYWNRYLFDFESHRYMGMTGIIKTNIYV